MAKKCSHFQMQTFEIIEEIASNYLAYKKNMYRTHAIISPGLYIFHPIVHCGLCTKQGNSSIFGPKIRGLQSRAVYNGTLTVYIYPKINY